MEKPVTLNIEIDPGLRTELINMSNYKGVSLGNYVVEAIKVQLNHDKGNEFAEKNLAQASVSPEEASRILKEFVESSD